MKKIKPVAVMLKIDLLPLKDNRPDLDKYKFKDCGYIELRWAFVKDINKGMGLNFLGIITPNELKERLGKKQWGKFCQGKREFIINRKL